MIRIQYLPSYPQNKGLDDAPVEVGHSVDVYAVHDFTISPGETLAFHTGMVIDFDPRKCCWMAIPSDDILKRGVYLTHTLSPPAGGSEGEEALLYAHNANQVLPSLPSSLSKVLELLHKFIGQPSPTLSIKRGERLGYLIPIPVYATAEVPID